ncbi:MAG: peroxidase-related enzyme [Acidobacteriota bacterium]
MQAHGQDLRAEIQDQPGGVERARAVMEDYLQADLPAAERRMLDFAVKLTRTPGAMSRADIGALRRCGFTDPAIHEIVQITALFNYYNRLAHGLGIDPEPP